MDVLSRVKLDEYYEQFKPLDVVFTREVIGLTGLLVRMVNLKCGTDFFPCVIYSTSFQEARVVTNTKSGIFRKLEASNDFLQLRFCFRAPETGGQIAFLAASRVTGTKPYNKSEAISVLTLQYTRRPPDDLIAIVGKIMEADYNYANRKSEIFHVNPELLACMKLAGGNVNIKAGGTVICCVLKELLFAGARLITQSAAARSLPDSNIEAVFEFYEPQKTCVIQCRVEKTDIVTGHPDLAVITLSYSGPVPLIYKYGLSNYVSTLKTEIKKIPPAPAKPEVKAGESAGAPPAPEENSAAPEKNGAAGGTEESAEVK